MVKTWKKCREVEHHQQLMMKCASPSTDVDETIWKGASLKPKHTIFLSHSGVHRDFTEQLCKDLEALQYFPFCDIRPSSLPKGEEFPPLIIQAAGQCRLAILVLSREYFMRSKWPMVELTEFVRAQRSTNPSLRIVPLYFKISIDEFKDVRTRARWKKKWQSWKSEDNRIDLKEWVRATKALEPINGIVYDEAQGEVTYRSKVVKAICKLTPPDLEWDDSYIQAMPRLCEPILQKLHEVGESNNNGVRIVGLFGMAGFGKTTISIALCHQLFGEFGGNVCHVEIGMDGKNLVNPIKEVLQKLTHPNKKLLRSTNDQACELVGLLKARLHQHRVFLVLDNVWENRIEDVRRLLEAGLQSAPGSKILVTSRSLVVLKSLSITENDCIQMPNLTEQDATNLFLHHAAPNLIHPINEREKEIIKRCVGQCLFSKRDLGGFMYHLNASHYHPLALKVWGCQLRDVSEVDPSKWMEASRTLENSHKLQFSKATKHCIFSVLRQGYDALCMTDQNIFLDLALFVPHFRKWNNMEHVWKWLSDIYDMSQDDIKDSLDVLRRKALLAKVSEDDLGIRIHDLYLDFAKDEAQGSGQWHKRRLLCDIGGKTIPQLLLKTPVSSGSELQRIRICKNKVLSLMKAKFHLCPNVQVLQLSECKKLEEVDVGGMDNLISLQVSGCKRLGPKFEGVEKLESLIWLQWRDMWEPAPFLQNMFYLTSLQVLHLGASSTSQLLQPPNLHGCINLRELSMSYHRKMRKFPDFSNLTNLEHVNFSELTRARGVPNLSKLSRLRTLVLLCCSKISGCLPGLSSLTNLEELILTGCKKISDLSGVCGLVALKRLMGLGISISRLPDLRKLRHLQHLNVSFCSKLRSLVGIEHATALERVGARNCRELKELPNFNNLRKLIEVDLTESSFCTTLPEGFEELAERKVLKLAHCWGLIKPLVDLLKELLSDGRHVTRMTHGCSSSNSYSNNPHSTNRLHCDMRKDINAAHYLGQIFIQDGWISPLRMCPRRTMEGIDIHSVIKAFCEHEDMGPLAYVIGTAAALGLHWPALAAPSTIETLACRIAQYFQRGIGAREQFLPKLRFLTVNHDMAKALKSHGLQR